MATKMTARIPATPETRKQLRQEVKTRDDVDTYDALLRTVFDERED